MVIGRVKGFLSERKKSKELRKKEEEKAQTRKDTEELKESESIKKEADRLAQLQQYETAIQEYKKALEISPYKGSEEDLFTSAKDFLFKLNFNIAASYTYLDQFDNAVAYFDKALAIDIDDADIRVKALMAKGSSYYRKKLFLEGKLEGSIIEPGSEKREKKDDEDHLQLAHDCFLKAVEIDRNNAGAWYNKGHMEFLKGNIKDAVTSFDNVLDVNKNYENKEGIPLFTEIKREKGIAIKPSELLNQAKEIQFKTKTGHLVENKAECQIADFLFENDLVFRYHVAVSWADKPEFRPSFYIPKLDVYLDHIDLKNGEANKSLKSRQKQFDKHKKKYIQITTDDDQNLEENLRIKLKPYIIL